jgi:hypothetical protein
MFSAEARDYVLNAVRNAKDNNAKSVEFTNAGFRNWFDVLTGSQMRLVFSYIFSGT